MGKMVGRCFAFWAPWLLMWSGCFQPAFSDHPACGADGECPADTRCLHDRCVVSGCENVADGELCASSNVADGVCYRHGCVPTGCGDGIVEPGEVCDDGNLVSGDGCSADCKSNEVCGNGHLDAVTGEQCDEGVRGLSGDGCSSQCTVEVLDWRATTLRKLTPRLGMGLAFDKRRGRMVMFGGATSITAGSNIAETWEYDGTNWFSRTPWGTPPGGRSSLSYDEARGRVVLSQLNANPWEYDGLSWRPLAKSDQSPCTGVYDPQRQATVCFDGTSTWSYNGADWKVLATTGTPPTLGGTMVFQSSSSCDLLLSDVDHLWKLCGTVWSAVATSGAPAGVMRLVYDSVRDLIVGFGDAGTWECDGATWLQRAAAMSLAEFAIAFDPVRGRTVVFGGYTPTRGIPWADTWEWDGATWTLQSRAVESSPPAGSAFTPVFDSVHGRTVTVADGEVWESEGVGWRRRATAHRPPNGPFVFDDNRGVLVLVADDMWEFDGVDWSHHATAHTPVAVSPANPGLRMAYDSARHLIVALVGGSVSVADTWIYNGIDWALAQRPARPFVRESMAFDGTRGRVVVFGGAFTRFDDRDDWDILSEFDGVGWRDVVTVGPHPSPRESASMAYDARRRRLVLHGGTHVKTAPVVLQVTLDDVWEFDGTSWSQLFTAANPSKGWMTFDGTRGRIATWSGPQVWTLSYASLATPPDACIAGLDTDGDGLVACGDPTHPADPDCASYCTPACPSWAASAQCDASAPHCGDHVCNAALEMGVCPQDCP